MASGQSSADALGNINKVLVTGASGFLGGHLVGRLREMGKSVVEVSRTQGFDVVRHKLPLDGVGHVFHLAGRAGVSDAWHSPLDFLDTNTVGTARVLEQCRNRCSMTFVSGHVYGNPKRLPIRETDPAEPQNPYALSKLLAEQVCKFYSDFYGVPAVVLRLFNVYGPGQDNSFLIPFVLGQLLDPQRAQVRVNDLTPGRDYVYVSDVIEAIVMAPRALAGTVFNVGSSEIYSVEDIIKRASKILGINKPYSETGERRREEIDQTRADISAFCKAVGWKPVVSIDDGLRMVAESMRR